jgi:ribonuclease BN (tRNA processing enzyme)
MFDCGRAATQKFVKAGLFPTQSDPRFFTHHFDHDVDYPAFLLTRRDKSMGRSESGRPSTPSRGLVAPRFASGLEFSSSV